MNFLEFLEYFVQTTKPKNWEVVAVSWVITVAVTAIVVTIIMLVYKFLRKKFASATEKETWTFWHTLMWMGNGFGLSFAAFFVFWFTKQEYSQGVVGQIGFINGAMFGWMIFLLIVVFFHLVVPSWRREMFSRRSLT